MMQHLKSRADFFKNSIRCIQSSTVNQSRRIRSYIRRITRKARIFARQVVFGNTGGLPDVAASLPQSIPDLLHLFG